DVQGITISVTTEDGETFPDLSKVSDGIAGDLVSWIPAFSKQRHKPLPPILAAEVSRAVEKQPTPRTGRPGASRKRCARCARRSPPGRRRCRGADRPDGDLAGRAHLGLELGERELAPAGG